MTLIELLTYIALLAIIMVGSVFSAYSIAVSVETQNAQNSSLNITTQNI